jgi:uncharacterized protein
MENFTNETINISELPKFETVQFTVLHKFYWKVILINIIGFFLILIAVAGISLVFVKELIPFRIEIIVAISILLFLILFFARLRFNKTGFAFRNHDVLFKHGVIATNTIVIPYNRVQHVALHEGLISRYFGLAKIEIFTAGGVSSDIEIPGIEKQQAENIKQLLMGKIQKQL